MMKATDSLLASNPFTFSEENLQLFVKSFQETANIHYQGNDFFKYIWDKEKIHPNDILLEKDLAKAPFILVNQFKIKEMLSCKRENIALTLGSSGTGGQRSLMHLDQGSLDRVKKLAYSIHAELGMTSSKKYNYLCFTYDPKVANDLGTAFTDELLTSFTGINEVYYTLQFNPSKNDFELNEQGVVDKLIEFSKSEYPTRILGFPAFLMMILKKYNLNLKLPKDSWLQTGGGWKGHTGEEIPKGEFRHFIHEKLGIELENIRDLFGMVEHGIPYVDCNKGKLRVPNFGRVFIRDPYTLKCLPDGEVGLIQFMCTYNSSYPSMNILSTDWGKLTKENDDIGGYSLEILGRAGTTKNKGCALKALELIEE